MTLPALPADLYSPDQLSQLLLELGDLRSVLQNAHARSKTGSKKQVALPELSATLVTLLEDAKVETDDTAAVDSLHAQLDVLLNKAPVAHIMLASTPNASVKRQLTEWFRKQISPYALLTFTARRDLCGGFVMQIGSQVYDFSFKRQLLNNKQKIIEVASRV